MASDYLSALELADLVGCKANQRAAMANWLDENRWSYVLASNGLPRVLREYRNKKLGLSNDQKPKAGLESGPNIHAFKQPPRVRGRSASL
ncbi:DUF4224 domain-containing protein [Achromobacter mucicolens]|uniref:DUF4224 domain-containing protein n=1 Tax=Achromobacter mucicolens TaxID=1389922 RepID=UPI003975B24E